MPLVLVRTPTYRHPLLHPPRAFLDKGGVRLPMDRRHLALDKAGIRHSAAARDRGFKAMVERLAVRSVGRVHRSVNACLQRVALP